MVLNAVIRSDVEPFVVVSAEESTKILSTGAASTHLSWTNWPRVVEMSSRSGPTAARCAHTG